jgi:4-hydroxybenzoate polyprenyltransferase
MLLLQLIRWKNLVIILLTQGLAWWCVVVHGNVTNEGVARFLCLSSSTMLIAAAGYAINDLFDVEIDQINKPQNVVVGDKLSRRQVLITYIAFNVVALVFSGYLAIGSGHPKWLLVQVVCIVLLWIYSARFKRQLMSGNIVVALLAALTVVVLMVYEPGILQSKVKVYVLGGYAFFAFMLTWVREIVKDIEDMTGDEQAGCRTLPVLFGPVAAGRMAKALSGAAVLFLLVSAEWLYKYVNMWPAIYILALVVFPLTALMFTFGRSNTTEQYHQLSQRLKALMLVGMGSLIVYYFNYA